jgi:hypothetical protein
MSECSNGVLRGSLEGERESLSSSQIHTTPKTDDDDANPWFTGQSSTLLRERYSELETSRHEAATRYRQELDNVCALASPRVAFEMRLIHLARTSTWSICSGLMGEVDDEDDDDEDNDDEDDDDEDDDDDDEQDDKQDKVHPKKIRHEGNFSYELISESLFRLDDDDKAFLMKDHGNDVSFGELDQQDHDVFLQKIYLTAEKAAQKDFTSMTVAELKNELTSRGLSVSGKKADLLARLQQ